MRPFLMTEEGEIYLCVEFVRHGIVQHAKDGWRETAFVAVSYIYDTESEWNEVVVGFLRGVSEREGWRLGNSYFGFEYFH